MRKALAGVLGLTLTAGLVAGAGGWAAAAPDDGRRLPAGQPQAASTDDLPNPLEEKRRALREEAVSQVINGQAKVQERNGSEVVRLSGGVESKQVAKGKRAPAAQQAKDRYVEVARERTDRVFVLLVEFGNERHPDFPDKNMNPTVPGPSTFEGPLHNAIPQPDRSVDNSTIWQADYSAAYFHDIYFGTGRGVQSLKTYYERQSSGRYTVDGTATAWLKVPYNEARYGRSNDNPTDANGNDPAVCSGNVCSNTWNLLDDGLDAWVAQQQAAGRTEAQIAAEMRSYDQWDRYDYDGDGNFNESDGYLDHIQIVHSGGDQADGDPYQGEDAVWSHRWRAFQSGEQGDGPANFPIGGTPVGNTGVWAADYTIQPENGGLSTIAHEYGHDLGLPDHYDTSAPAGVDNPVNWWTLMAQSRASAKNDVGIGTRAADLSAWDKLQLGWLDYEVVRYDRPRTLELGPHEYNSSKAQGLVVPLPKKSVDTDLPDPPEGENSWWSGTGDDYSATMTRNVTLPAGTSTLTFDTSYNIEDCEEDPCDYAFVEVKAGSADWVALPGTPANPDENNGIDGFSDGWVEASFNLSAYAGQTVQLRVRYETDGAAQGQNPDEPAGIFVDNLAITNGTQVIFADGAESGANGWTLVGFRAIGATLTTQYDHYYIASNREYISYDRYLRSGPYNFGFPDKPDWVEHFPYQDGVLVSYWDTSQSDNDTSVHPGEGLILPIDAHPDLIYRLDGAPWRQRIQGYDAPFSLQKADSFTLHIPTTGQASYVRGQDAQPLFNDRRNYFRQEGNLSFGVKTPGIGVTLRVTAENGTSTTVRIGYSPPSSAAMGTR